MEELWSNDRATGSRVRTARDMNSPPDMTNFSVNLGENNMDYIPEQPNFEEADDYVPRSPAAQFQSSDTLQTHHQTLLLCRLLALRAHPHPEDQREKAPLCTALNNLQC